MQKYVFFIWFWRKSEIHKFSDTNKPNYTPSPSFKYKLLQHSPSLDNNTNQQIHKKMPGKNVSVKFHRRLEICCCVQFHFHFHLWNGVKVALKFSVNAFISILLQCPQCEMCPSYERNLFSMPSAQLAKNMSLRVSINNWMSWQGKMLFPPPLPLSLQTFSIWYCASLNARLSRSALSMSCSEMPSLRTSSLNRAMGISSSTK